MRKHIPIFFGIDVAGSTPEALRKEVTDEIVKWTKAIKDAGIKQE